MNIAIIGGGGRESALAWAVKRSPKCANLYILPGNGGTKKYGRNVPAKVSYPFTELLEFVELAQIDLVIVGPEQPLVDGLTDILRQKKVPVFGPSQKAARLEGSKAYMKEFLARYNIPTARFKIFTDANEAINYVRSENRPFVVKTDGLAAGKGAIVNKTVEETLETIHRVLVKKEFGASGEKIIVEDLLSGTEVSVFIATDGTDFRWLASAQDHKRINDRDEGPNTGGMGAYAPAPFINDKLKEIITDNIIRPTVRGMHNDGCPYTGILYVGLMLTDSGPSVIEYNVRWGDPEAQVVLPLLKTDYIDIAQAVIQNKLRDLKLEYMGGYCTGVVLASGGYPGKYETGYDITGSLQDTDEIFVFHAGTCDEPQGTLTTDGGRVMCVSALGKTLRESIEKAYSRVGRISFKNMHYRKDIGRKGLEFIEK